MRNNLRQPVTVELANFDDNDSSWQQNSDIRSYGINYSAETSRGRPISNIYVLPMTSENIGRRLLFKTKKGRRKAGFPGFLNAQTALGSPAGLIY